MSLFNPFRAPLKQKSFASLIEKALGLKPLNSAYDSRPANLTAEEFLDYTLQSLKVSVSLDGALMQEEIPETGPLIVVANHPFGGLDGVALTRAVLSVRSDTKVLTNQMLASIPEFSDLFLGVDVLSKQAINQNRQGVRAADQHLGNGGVLIVFPAGEVSAVSWSRFSVQDRSWNTMVGRLALKHHTSCLPVFVQGHNPLYFYAAGLVHKRLRTLLLPRQLSNKLGSQLKMTVGKRLTNKECAKSVSAQALTLQLRISTYFLAASNEPAHKSLALPSNTTHQVKQSKLVDDINRLEPYKLLTKGEFGVYCAPFHELHSIFLALAEARELTFRAAGEGTGKTHDHDQYDKYYLHLFVWDHKNNAIVGGYRLGETDKIIAQHGVSGLYSRSLYKFDERYMEKFGSALEVGRSFVTQAYQRHPSALDLLWRGIGHFVAQHPQYSKLFGCVSISSEHSTMARAFISDAMMESYRAEQRFLDDVKPLVPLRVKNKVWTRSMLATIQDIAVINKLVGLCEPGKTVPVLLRHYVALNGKFIGFSINRGFNDSLDGLILVDLHQMPERYLNRYLTKEGAEHFKQHREQYERVN